MELKCHTNMMSDIAATNINAMSLYCINVSKMLSQSHMLAGSDVDSVGVFVCRKQKHSLFCMQKVYYMDCRMLSILLTLPLKYTL